MTPVAGTRGLTVVVALLIVVVVWRRRPQPGATPFALLMLAAAEWAGGALLEHTSREVASKVVFAALEYPGIMAMAPLWLAFALAYTGHAAALTAGRAAALAVMPLVTIALVWTNPWHHLVWTSFTPSSPVAGAPLVYGHGAWFWLAAAWNYALLLAGTIVLVISLARAHRPFRAQGAALLLGMVLPWIGNALYLSGAGVLGGVDPTPLAFVLTGIVYSVGVFHRGLFDLVPIARHALIDSMADGVLVLDARQRVIDVNPSARALLGLATAPIGAAAADVLAPWPALAAAAAGAPMAAAARVETARGPRDLQVGQSLLLDAAGAPRGRLLVMSDVTDRKRTEDALRQTEKLASLGQLLAGVAHELNNPLSVVIGHATLLRREMGDAPGAGRVEKIAVAAERCARIVANFLAVARRREPERTTTDLNAVLRDAVALLAHQLELDNVSVVQRLAADLPRLRADTSQLHQVAVNLISNAQYAMRESAGERRLTLASRHDFARGRVIFSVADTGPGIPLARRDRIFEPFFTTKPVGSGSGLGLSVCRGIVEAHEGAIEIGDAPGGGALVTVELPVTTAAPPAEAGARAAADLVRGKRILVVDDEPAVAEVLREMLAEDGHRVDVAPHGRAALERLGVTEFDVIISDFKMPVLDGAGLYQGLVARDPRLRDRLVFISGDTLAPDTRRFIQTTGVPTLDKPFEAADVRRVVQQVLARR